MSNHQVLPKDLNWVERCTCTEDILNYSSWPSLCCSPSPHFICHCFFVIVSFERRSRWADQIHFLSSHFLFLGCPRTMDRTPRIVVSLFSSTCWQFQVNCFRSLCVFIAFWDEIINIPELTASVPSHLKPTIQSNMCPSFRKQAEQMPNSCAEHFPHERAALACIFVSFVVGEKSGSNSVINRDPLPLLFGLILQTFSIWSGGWQQRVWRFQILSLHQHSAESESWKQGWLCAFPRGSARTRTPCLALCSAVVVLNFWTRGPHFHLALRLTCYVTSHGWEE